MFRGQMLYLGAEKLQKQLTEMEMVWGTDKSRVRIMEYSVLLLTSDDLFYSVLPIERGPVRNIRC